MTANYLEENDMLQEVGAILRGDSRKLPTLAHLHALEQLVRTAAHLLTYADVSHDRKLIEGRLDWLREAAKALGPAESSASQ
jgi:hypothetical protein